MGKLGSFFFFGVLPDRDIRDLVIGRSTAHNEEEGVLPGFRRVRVSARVQPMLVKDPNSEVRGIIVHDLDAHGAARITHYEGNDYAAQPCQVVGADGRNLDAWVFVPQHEPDATNGEWNLERWRRRFKRRTLHIAKEWMARADSAALADCKAKWEHQCKNRKTTKI